MFFEDSGSIGFEVYVILLFCIKKYLEKYFLHFQTKIFVDLVIVLIKIITRPHFVLLCLKDKTLIKILRMCLKQ